MNETQQFVEDFESIEGYFTIPEGLLARKLASMCTGKGVIVEIGSYQGKSTLAWSRGAPESVKVYSVDINHGKENCKNFPGTVDRLGMTNVITVPGASVDIAATWDKPVELVFIDGSHDYTDVKSDFAAWFPHVIPGGYMAFHDTAGWWPGPTRVMMEEVFGKWDRFCARGGVDSLTYAIKAGGAELSYRLYESMIMGGGP